MSDRADLPEPLLDSARIADRVDALAAEISAAYADAGELYLVGVLRGAFIFLADLSRRLTVPRRADFIAVASYADGDQRSGSVRLIMDLRADIEGRHVLVVEDIVDTGHTLAYLMDLLSARRPASLRSCALVRKPARQQVPVRLDWVGFDIPDVWVVGYGLDYNDRFRTLPYIGIHPPDPTSPG